VGSIADTDCWHLAFELDFGIDPFIVSIEALLTYLLKAYQRCQVRLHLLREVVLGNFAGIAVAADYPQPHLLDTRGFQDLTEEAHSLRMTAPLLLLHTAY